MIDLPYPSGDFAVIIHTDDVQQGEPWSKGISPEHFGWLTLEFVMFGMDDDSAFIPIALGPFTTPFQAITRTHLPWVIHPDSLKRPIVMDGIQLLDFHLSKVISP